MVKPARDSQCQLSLYFPTSYVHVLHINYFFCTIAYECLNLSLVFSKSCINCTYMYIILQEKINFTDAAKNMK